MFLGIDVSKKSLDVALSGAGPKLRHKVFTTDASGHGELLAWLKQHSADAVHACLEATGLGPMPPHWRCTPPAIVSVW